MATSARIGSLTQILRGSAASPPVYTLIPEVQTIPPIGETRERVEATHLMSTSKEYIGGLPDGSELSLAVNYIPANVTHAALLADYAANVAVPFRMIFLGGVQLSFDAVVLGYEYSGGPNDIVTLTFTLQITGSVTQA